MDACRRDEARAGGAALGHALRMLLLAAAVGVAGCAARPGNDVLRTVAAAEPFDLLGRTLAGG